VSDPLCLHASCVAYDGRAVLILGKSGAGKSSLALQLLGLGCDLVADDQTLIDPDLTARCPDAIAGKIEARGVGILAAPHVTATIALVVDLDTEETERLPAWHNLHLHDSNIPLLRKSNAIHFPFAILQYLKHGRTD
jgi:HPr kinase/phosphorylase